MEDTSGFYKLDNLVVIYGPNFVLNKDFELRRETREQHTYPTDGWYWFDSMQQAYDFFGVEMPKVEEEQTRSIRHSSI